MRSIFFFIVVLLGFCLNAITVFAQCPPNIGFEDGTLTFWQCDTGSCRGGNLRLSPSPAIPGRHTILQNTSPQQLDVYGHFVVNCPNGSGYSLLLGNSASNAKATQVSYSFVVPADQPTYNVIYYYAVVFQNPADHTADQQPKFTANVFDVTDNKYADCGSFQFVSSANLPGFQKSDIGQDVYYKPWSPITISLVGYQGKTVRIEFTATDCTKGGHFGYAYLDVDQNCQSPIAGSNYCLGSSQLTLTAPAGFQSYQWYTDDLQTPLGNDPSLVISPPPPDGTRYAVKITAYPGLGCDATLYATAHPVDETYKLAVQSKLIACQLNGADLTAAAVTAGSSPNQRFEYFNDPYGQDYVLNPSQVEVSGTYYIRGTNAVGCTDIQPVQVTIYPTPNLLVQSPPPVCKPATIDITDSKWITNYNPDFTYTYWADFAATQPLSNPKAISVSGTYYIKAETTGIECTQVVPIVLVISDLPKVTGHDLISCPPANLTADKVTEGSDGGLQYTYWLDAATTQELKNPDKVAAEGTYYIKGTNVYGCSSIAPVKVSLLPVPDFSPAIPAAVIYPATVSLARTYRPQAGITYTYWKDAAATQPLDNYLAVSESGTYYIKAANQAGCFEIKPVYVTINPPLTPVFSVSNTFSPNGDGVNDLFTISINGAVQVKKLTIYNRWGQQVFESKSATLQWDGSFNGKIQATGTFYWVLDCYEIYYKRDLVKSGYIALIR